MQQYFAKNKNLELQDGDYHHIKNVMKMKIGDLIKVVFENNTYECKITSINPNVSFEIIKKEKTKKESLKIAVAFCLIKEQKQDYLLQKATEMGAFEFFPVISKRCVVKIDDKKMESKIKRWQVICKEASEQSFRESIPLVNQVLKLKDLANCNYDLKLLCSLNKNSKNIKKILQKNDKCDKILIVIGPEGGFDPSEEKYLMENGFVFVSLGENVLRAETAPVVALSMIKYEFER